METNKIYQGDSLYVLKNLPSESMNCVMTSPPYWGLRDYGVEGQLGLEPTFQEYINKLCDIFDEVKRILKKDGTCFIVLDDIYFAGSGTTGVACLELGRKFILIEKEKEYYDMILNRIKPYLEQEKL